MRDKIVSRPPTANTDDFHQKRPSSSFSRISFDLRPKSAFPTSKARKRGSRNTSISGQPGSGRYSFYTGSDVGSSLIGSRPTSGYTSRVTSARTLRDGLTSGRPSTCTIREGARSPTPNAIKDMEPAFFDVQMTNPGVTVWRIQGSSLRTIEGDEIGFFHEANAYLILSVSESEETSLHYWTGNYCIEKDAKLVEEKAHELDKILSYAHIFSRETQGCESYNFLKHFTDGIVYLEGKHRACIKESAVYDKRLYNVTGRKYPRACCVYPSKEYLQTDNALILDGHPRIYVWIGRECNYITRIKAIRIAQRLMRIQRKGKCHIIVIDEYDIERHDVFVKKLDSTDAALKANHLVNNQYIDVTHRQGDQHLSDSNKHLPNIVLHSGDLCHLLLTFANSLNLAQDQLNVCTDLSPNLKELFYRLSGDRVLYDMPEASRRPLNHRYLVKKDSYLLDRGPNNVMYVWVGSCATEEELQKGLDRGKAFAEHKAYSSKRTICRIRENHEPLAFKNCFCDWKDRCSRETALTKTYTIGNVERALFSHTDRRTIAMVKEFWSDEGLESEEGTTQVWVLSGEKQESWQHYGVFNNDKCYLVLYSTVNTTVPVHLIYYWLGAKSSKEDKNKIVQLAFDTGHKLQDNAVMIRVLDGKEPQHFMAVLNNWMMVYDCDITSSPQQTTQMYCVRGMNLDSVRIQQVKARWSNLNSAASFVILTSTKVYLWYGKDSGCIERESTKELIALICSERMFSYEIVAEGKEPPSFYEAFGKKYTYEAEFPTKAYERRIPTLTHCKCKEGSVDFTVIDDFLQEDLTEEDVFVLDIFDEIFIWCGSMLNDATKIQLPEIAMEYLRLDPAGRNKDEILILYVSQGNEPTFFTKFFTNWDTYGYSELHLYESLRKRIRQENAKINITESLIDRGYIGQPKYPYKMLMKKELPEDVDDTHKEYHLTEKQFREYLLVSRQEFYHLPLWKQRQILRSAKLFYTPPLPLHTLELTES